MHNLKIRILYFKLNNVNVYGLCMPYQGEERISIIKSYARKGIRSMEISKTVSITRCHFDNSEPSNTASLQYVCMYVPGFYIAPQCVDTPHSA